VRWPQVEAFLHLRQIVKPNSRPQPGGDLLYVKSDDALYSLGADGTERRVGGDAVAATARLMSKLRANQTDASLVYVGDSTTAIYGTPWTTRIATKLAAQFPAYTVKIAQWNTNNTPYIDPGDYGTWTTLQTGTGSHTLWVYNGGAGGTNCRYPLTRLTNMVVTPAPDLVIIDHGANELAFTSSHLPDDFRAAYLCLTESIRAAVSTASLLCVSQHVVTTAGAPDSFLVAEMIRQVCEARGYGYVNMTQVFADLGAARTDYMTDGAHCNDLGQTLWADTLWSRAFVGTLTDVTPQMPSTFVNPVGKDILLNGQFGSFDGTNAPYGWVLANATLAKDTVNFEGTNGNAYSLKMTSLGTGIATLYQGVSATILARLKGKYVTLTAKVNALNPVADSSSSRGTLQLYDGTTASAGIFDIWSDGNFVYHSVTLKVSPTATQLTAYLICDNLGTNVGTVNSWEWATLVEGILPSCPETVSGQFVQFNYAQTLADTQKQQAAVNAGLRRTPEGVVESGKYWILAGSSSVTTMALTASREYAVPFEVTSEVTVNELDVEVTTAAAASTVRLGIRAHSPATGEPLSGAPLVDAGTIDSTTTGVKPKAISSLNLKPGWYWYTVTAQGGAPTVRASAPFAVAWPAPTKAASAAAISQFNALGYYQDGVTGALPSTWASSPNVFGTPRMLAKNV
jgi:lysophospholipase L1-like esterase